MHAISPPPLWFLSVLADHVLDVNPSTYTSSFYCTSVLHVTGWTYREQNNFGVFPAVTQFLSVMSSFFHQEQPPPPASRRVQQRVGVNTTTTLVVSVPNRIGGHDSSFRPKVSRRVPAPTPGQMVDYVSSQGGVSKPPAAVLLRHGGSTDGRRPPSTLCHPQKKPHVCTQPPTQNIQVLQINDSSRPSSARDDSRSHYQTTAWAAPTVEVSINNDRYRMPRGNGGANGRPKSSRRTAMPELEQRYDYLLSHNKPAASNMVKPEYGSTGSSRIMTLGSKEQEHLTVDQKVPVPKVTVKPSRAKDTKTGSVRLADHFTDLATRKRRDLDQQRSRGPNTATSKSTTASFSRQHDLVAMRQDNRKELATESCFKLSERFHHLERRRQSGTKKKFHPSQEDIMYVNVNGRRGMVVLESKKGYAREEGVSANDRRGGSGDSSQQAAKQKVLYVCRAADILPTQPKPAGTEDNVLKSDWFRKNHRHHHQRHHHEHYLHRMEEDWRPAWNTSTKLAKGLKERLERQTLPLSFGRCESTHLKRGRRSTCRSRRPRSRSSSSQRTFRHRGRGSNSHARNRKNSRSRSRSSSSGRSPQTPRSRGRSSTPRVRSKPRPSLRRDRSRSYSPSSCSEGSSFFSSTSSDSSESTGESPNISSSVVPTPRPSFNQGTVFCPRKWPSQMVEFEM